MQAFKKKYNKSQAFTLIELLLYIGILVVIISGTSTFLFITLESQTKNQTIAEVEQQGAQLMQIITQNIRNADGINLPVSGSNAPSLSISTIQAATNPTIFDLSSGTVRIKEGASAVIPLTSSKVIISGLTFYNLSRASTPGTIRVEFTISRVNNSGRNEYDFSKTFRGSATIR